MQTEDTKEESQDQGLSVTAPFYQKFLKDKKLEDIYIWAMNQRSGDINNHSPVVSFKIPHLEKTFICTGDADHEVFQSIEEEIGKALQKDTKSSTTLTTPLSTSDAIDIHLHDMAMATPKFYTVLLMLPHHGAKTNQSVTMLNLFRPHMLGISAGAGSMYNHPSTTLIKSYEEYYKEFPHLRQRKTEFWERHSPDDSHSYISFRDKKITDPSNPNSTLTVQKAQLNTLSDGFLPIISTGIAGTIYINAENFYSQFTSCFEYNGKVYKINFKKPAFTHISGKKFDGNEIVKGSEVNFPITTQRICYKRKTKTREYVKQLGDIFLFSTTDGKRILLPLDIKYKVDKNKKAHKSVKSFYHGRKIEGSN